MQVHEKKTINPSCNRVGYFCHLILEARHMGAIMVTNRIGVPLEFKYTEPVVATGLHRILYGSVLEKYLRETVIRERLGRELQQAPDYFITQYDEKEYLGKIADREMMAVQKYLMPPQDMSGPFMRVREREAIVEIEENSLFLRLAFSTENESAQHAMADWLREIAGTMDVMEPLDRIKSALISLCGDVKRN
ncbi:MAG TPA: hypothetical protein VLL97_03520 [Acidobacteriota bacterium]|nr:hypothetical protein [Acidobacteriota bacterium]